MSKNSEYINPAIVELPAVMIVVGRRKSGKTRLLVRMLLDDKFLKGKFDRIVVVSPTFLLDGNWSCISTDGLEVHTSYDDDFMGELIDCQKQNGAEDSVCVILDACVTEGTKTENIDTLATNGRHLNVTLIYLTQKITSVSTIVRANFDQIIHFYSSSKRERQNLNQDVDIPEEVFLYSTKDPYTFLNAINRGGAIQLYKCFSEKISFEG